MALLVVRLGAMGDILRTLPAVRLLRRSLPDADIRWVLDDRWQVLLDEHPALTGTVILPRRAWARRLRSPLAWPGFAGEWARLRERLRSPRADLLLDFHGNLRSGLIASLAGAPVRVGYAGHQQKEGNRWFTTHRVPAGDRRTSRIERNLDLVRGLGLAAGPLPDGGLERMIAKGDRAAAEIAARHGAVKAGIAVVCPGASASQAYKRPPPELLAAACSRLADRGVVPLLVYGPGEETDARRVLERTGDRAALAPPTDLPALGALLSRARLFVGGDSGPMHLACAVGCPVLAIYGPTDPRVNAPWHVPHVALSPPGRRYTGVRRTDREGGGFDGLTPELVRGPVDALLDATQPRAEPLQPSR